MERREQMHEPEELRQQILEDLQESGIVGALEGLLHDSSTPSRVSLKVTAPRGILMVHTLYQLYLEEHVVEVKFIVFDEVVTSLQDHLTDFAIIEKDLHRLQEKFAGQKVNIEQESPSP